MTTQRYVPPVTETANELAEREGSTRRTPEPTAPPAPQPSRRKRLGVAGWIGRILPWAGLLGVALLFLYPLAWPPRGKLKAAGPGLRQQPDSEDLPAGELRQ